MIKNSVDNLTTNTNYNGLERKTYGLTMLLYTWILCYCFRNSVHDKI